MSRWPGKYVIGLTGNIATGKSVVRKMLEHVGAFGVDADVLAHQAIAKGGPAHAQVVKSFGEWLLNEDGDIDRARLGRVVFADPQALARLEAFVHPYVGQAIDFLVKRTKSRVVVIEAIKLLESGLGRDCDAIWVVHAPENIRVARLVKKRHMPAEEAQQRVNAQPSQTDKVRAASVVIENTGSFEDTWTQVQAAFTKIMQTGPAAATDILVQPSAKAGAPDAKTVRIRRGKPTDATAIAEFIQRATAGARTLTRGDVMAAFGEKAYMLADYGGELAAIAGWKVENLVARVDEFYMAAGAPLDKVTPPLIEAVEAASRELQSEAALVFVPTALAQPAATALAGSGFSPQATDKLGVAAWKEAAKDSMPPETTLLFKKLREDRVLKPI